MTTYLSRYSLLRFVLGALLTVTVVEAAVRLGADLLIDANQAGRWPTNPAAEQVAEVDQLVSDRVAVDVVLAGPSHVQNGIDPRALQQASGLLSFNAAMNAAWPEVQQHWLETQIVDRLDPQVVVFGLAPVDFSERHAADLVEPFKAFAEADASPYRDAENQLSRVSATVEHRHRIKHVLTSPGSLLEASSREPEDPGLLGFRPREEGRTFFDEDRGAVIDAFQPYEVDQADLTAMRAVIADLIAGGTEVVLLLMPQPEQFDELVASVGADLAAFDRAVADLASDFDLLLLDHRDLVPDDMFSDYTHLKPNGAELLSTTLGLEVSEYLDR